MGKKVNKYLKLFSFSLSLSVLTGCGTSPVLPPDLTYNSSALTLPKKNCGCTNGSTNNGSIPQSPDVSGTIQVPEDSKPNPLTPVTSKDEAKDDELGIGGDDLPELDTEMPESGVDNDSGTKEKTKVGKMFDNVKNFFRGIFKKKES